MSSTANTPLSRNQFLWLSAAGFAGFFALWTLIAWSGLVQKQFLPAPLDVLFKFIELTQTPFVGFTLQQIGRAHV